MAFRAEAATYTNGWTAETFRSGVAGCVESVVAKQRQYLQSTGRIKADATQVQIKALDARLTTYATNVCTCAFTRIMREVAFQDVSSLRQRPEYVRELMTECSNEVAKTTKE